MRIGTDPNKSEPLHIGEGAVGIIDEMRVYDCSVHISEIKYLYWNPAGGGKTYSGESDKIATNLGYVDYADLVAKAKAGDTVISGGYINTDLIETGSLLVGQIGDAGDLASKNTVGDADITSISGGKISTGSIKSTDYVAGVSGWNIDLAGDVEFNDGTFRGDINIGDGTFIVEASTGLITYNSSKVALGANAVASGANSTAVGVSSQSTGVDSTSYGKNANASGITSLAIGNYASATASDATAIGSSARAFGTAFVAIGKYALAADNRPLDIKLPTQALRVLDFPYGTTYNDVYDSIYTLMGYPDGSNGERNWGIIGTYEDEITRLLFTPYSNFRFYNNANSLVLTCTDGSSSFITSRLRFLILG